MQTLQPLPSRSQWGRALLGGVLLVIGLASSLAAQPAEAPACADCHDDVAGAFTQSSHGRAFRLDSAYAGSSCESCHGSGAQHMDSGDAADIQNPAHLKGAAADRACLTCHQNDRRHALWEGSEHERAGVACVDCHGVHGGKPARRPVAVASTTELCLSCHTAQRPALAQRSGHPIRAGKMECASCHNPHGTTNEHLVAADSVNDLCFSCHQDKRGPFLWEHAPVREDCMSCHKSHGSNHESLLVARVNQLCQSCHLQGRHQTVAGTSAAVWNTNRACVNCHPQIHGSNHPSGPLFQR